MRKMTSAGVIALGLVTACSGSGRIQETATTVPHRDLTLSTSLTPSTAVASKIELAPVKITHRSKPTRPAAPIRVKAPLETPVAAPAPELAPALAPAPSVVAEAPRPDPNSHELSPGATVTMIPVSTASSSPTSAGVGWSEIPSPRPGGGVTISGWPGGHCGSGGGGGRGLGPVSILE